MSLMVCRRHATQHQDVHWKHLVQSSGLEADIPVGRLHSSRSHLCACKFERPGLPALMQGRNNLSTFGCSTLNRCVVIFIEDIMHVYHRVAHRLMSCADYQPMLTCLQQPGACLSIIPEGFAGIFVTSDANTETIFLSQRKGFIKLALQSGAGELVVLAPLCTNV